MSKAMKLTLIAIAITLVLTTIALWLQNRTQTRPGESSP